MINCGLQLKNYRHTISNIHHPYITSDITALLVTLVVRFLYYTNSDTTSVTIANVLLHYCTSNDIALVMIMN